jgi:hypothetical protein
MQRKVENTVRRAAYWAARRKAQAAGYSAAQASGLGLVASGRALDAFEGALREKKRKARKLAKRQRQRNRGVRS